MKYGVNNKDKKNLFLIILCVLLLTVTIFILSYLQQPSQRCRQLITSNSSYEMLQKNERTCFTLNNNQLSGITHLDNIRYGAKLAKSAYISQDRDKTYEYAEHTLSLISKSDSKSNVAQRKEDREETTRIALELIDIKNDVYEEE